MQGLRSNSALLLLYTMLHVILGGWEASFGVEVGSSPIKGGRIMFLLPLIEDVQKHFNEF